MRSTCARIHEKLARDGLVYRYETGTDDGLPPGEGAFGICSFWAVECVARGGNVGAATGPSSNYSLTRTTGLFAEDRPRHRRGTRELPAGVHAHRAHQRGALAGYQEGSAAAERPSNDIPTEDPT